MKVVVSADGDDLEAPVAPSFARCPFFMVVDPEDLSYQSISNGSAARDAGAGREAAALVSRSGATVVIASTVGPNAFYSLQQAGIQMFAAPGMTVRSAVKAYRAAHLSPLPGPSRPRLAERGRGHFRQARAAGASRRRGAARDAASGASLSRQIAELQAALATTTQELEQIKAQLASLERRPVE